MPFLFVACHHKAKFFLGSWHSHIQHIGIISKVGNLIVHHTHNNSIVFTSLIFVNSTSLGSNNLTIESIHLIIVRRDNAYVIIIFQNRQHLFLHHVNFSLIIVINSMVAFDCPYGSKNIFFAFVLCHNEQVATIKLLVAEIDNSRMTAVMFSQ